MIDFEQWQQEYWRDKKMYWRDIITIAFFMPLLMAATAAVVWAGMELLLWLI